MRSGWGWRRARCVLGRIRLGWLTRLSRGFRSGSCSVMRSAWEKRSKRAWLSGNDSVRVVKRVLILVPKSVLVQWQRNCTKNSCSTFPATTAARSTMCSAGNCPVAGTIILGQSSGHARFEPPGQAARAATATAGGTGLGPGRGRRSSSRPAEGFQNTDLFRPNRLLELLRGPENRPGLCDKTRGLLLLTATPMQIDPREVSTCSS